MSIEYTINELINQPRQHRDLSWSPSSGDVAGKELRASAGTCVRFATDPMSPLEPVPDMSFSDLPLYTHGKNLSRVKERCIILKQPEYVPGVTPADMATYAVLVSDDGTGATFLHSAPDQLDWASNLQSLLGASDDGQRWYLTASPSADIQMHRTTLNSGCSQASVLASLQSGAPAICTQYRYTSPSLQDQPQKFTFEGFESDEIKTLMGRSGGEPFLLLLKKADQSDHERLKFAAFHVPHAFGWPSDNSSANVFTHHDVTHNLEEAGSTMSLTQPTLFGIEQTMHIHPSSRATRSSIGDLKSGAWSLSSGSTLGHPNQLKAVKAHHIASASSQKRSRYRAQSTRTRGHPEAIDPVWFGKAWAMHAVMPPSQKLSGITPEGYRTMALLVPTPTVNGYEAGAAFLHQYDVVAGDGHLEGSSAGASDTTLVRMDVLADAMMLTGDDSETYLETVSAYELEVYSNATLDALLCIIPETSTSPQDNLDESGSPPEKATLRYVQMQLQWAD